MNNTLVSCDTFLRSGRETCSTIGEYCPGCKNIGCCNPDPSPPSLPPLQCAPTCNLSTAIGYYNQCSPPANDQNCQGFCTIEAGISVVNSTDYTVTNFSGQVYGKLIPLNFTRKVFINGALFPDPITVSVSMNTSCLCVLI